jgi:hypothetical protein
MEAVLIVAVAWMALAGAALVLLRGLWVVSARVDRAAVPEEGEAAAVARIPRSARS